MKVKPLSRIRLLATPWTAAHQAPPSMRFSRQEYGVGCHCLLHYLSLGLGPISVPCHQFPQGTTITSISMPLSPPIWYIISHLRTSIASHPYTSSPSIFGPHLSPPTLAILYFSLLCSHHLLYLSSHHFPLCASVAFRPGTLTSPCFHPCAFTSSHSVPNCCL